MRSTSGAKLFMWGIHITAVVAGIYAAVWSFETLT